MTEVYYVRHAEPNYENHDDRMRELTEKGLRDLSTTMRRSGVTDIVMKWRNRRG